LPLFTPSKNTKQLLQTDIDFLLKLISNVSIVKTLPLTDRGKVILKMVWGDHKSFNEVAEELQLSPDKVIQVYHLEIRRLSYFIDALFKEFSELKYENELLIEENKKLKQKFAVHK